ADPRRVLVSLRGGLVRDANAGSRLLAVVEVRVVAAVRVDGANLRHDADPGLLVAAGPGVATAVHVVEAPGHADALVFVAALGRVAFFVAGARRRRLLHTTRA